MLAPTHAVNQPVAASYLWTEVEKDNHLKAYPLSDINQQILFDRGDHLFSMLSGAKKCKGITAGWFNTLPSFTTFGSVVGGVVGVSLGPPISYEIVSKLWEVIFPKADATGLSRLWNGLLFMGKSITEYIFFPRVNPTIAALTGIGGGIAVPVAMSLMSGLYAKGS